MSTLGVTLGALEVSILISTILYGVTSLQTFLYTAKSFKDPRWLHIMVCRLLETVHTAFTWILLYSYTVTNYGNPGTIISTPWFLAYSFVFTSFIGSIVQTFFAYRIRVLSGSLVVPIIAWCAAASRVGTGITLGVLISSFDTLTAYVARYSWLETTHLTVDAAVDVTITASLCYYLLLRKTTFKPTQRMVHRLVVYTVVVSYGFTMIYPRCITVFSNSFLTALNARQSLRRTGADTGHAWSTGDICHDEVSMMRFGHGPNHLKDAYSKSTRQGEIPGYTLQHGVTVELESTPDDHLVTGSIEDSDATTFP
ncbi:hypothetical protein K439DRAFT_1631100 [Ramaria rubella]|nr:hypothetical protein K439DRAFT_1631100 [Ramaria rubella]